MSNAIKTIPGRFNSIKDCAAFFRIRSDLLTWAKKQGCQAFTKNNGVHSLPLIEFLFGHHGDDDGVTDYSVELKKWQASREKRKDTIEGGQVLEKSEVASAVIKAITAMQSAMARANTVEGPSYLRGRDGPEIETWLNARDARIMNLFKQSLERLSNKTKAEKEEE